jgi:hypothetical protein
MSLATAEQATSTTCRAANGRFGFGNPGGPGNPNVRRIAAMRQAVFEAVSPEDVREIMVALVAQAKEGDREAAKVVLQYTLGKPGTWDPATNGMPGEADGAANRVAIAVTPPQTTNTARPAALTPLQPEGATSGAERLLGRRDSRPELTVEQMMGITPPSTNGANGPKGAAVLPSVAVVGGPSVADENGRRDAEHGRTTKK